jgi:hypothetical protein
MQNGGEQSTLSPFFSSSGNLMPLFAPAYQSIIERIETVLSRPVLGGIRVLFPILSRNSRRASFFGILRRNEDLEGDHRATTNYVIVCHLGVLVSLSASSTFCARSDDIIFGIESV